MAPPFLMGAPFPVRAASAGCPPGPDLPGLGVTCILHLRADLGVTTVGGEVTLWEDQSGIGDSGRNFAPPGTDKPALNACHLETAYNNKPTIGTFRKSGVAADCALASGTWNATYTHFSIFVIGHAIYSPNRSFTYESSTDFVNISTVGGASPYVIPNGGIVVAGASATFVTDYNFILVDSAPNLLGAEFNGASSKLYVNALDAPDDTGTLTASSLGNAPLYVGQRPGIGALTYGVERIAEVVAFNGALSAGDLSDLSDYFNTRYGMSMP